MTRKTFREGGGFEEAAAYSRAVRIGRHVAVSGTAAREGEPLAVEGVETDEHFRGLLSLLAQADLLRYSVARGDGTPLDARSDRIVREALA